MSVARRITWGFGWYFLCWNIEIIFHLDGVGLLGFEASEIIQLFLAYCFSSRFLVTTYLWCAVSMDWSAYSLWGGK